MYDWIDGTPYADHLVDDEREAAKALAGFVLELRGAVAAASAPPTGRRTLAELDASTRESIAAADGPIDGAATLAAWEDSVAAPSWTGDPVLIHTDLLRPNVLVKGGQVEAVLDFGAIGAGDPAADVIAAWSIFGSVGRPIFRDALEVDDATWIRARGYALHQAAAIIPYHRDSNVPLVAQAIRTIEQVLADRSG